MSLALQLALARAVSLHGLAPAALHPIFYNKTSGDQRNFRPGQQIIGCRPQVDRELVNRAWEDRELVNQAWEGREPVGRELPPIWREIVARLWPTIDPVLSITVKNGRTIDNCDLPRCAVRSP
jgi:hypothetical protein